MKKILLAVMAVAAIGFTSCNNKTQQGEATDSTEVVINVDEEANATIAALTEQIEAKDANKFQEVLATVKALSNYALSYENFLMSRWLANKKPQDFQKN